MSSLSTTNISVWAIFFLFTCRIIRGLLFALLNNFRILWWYHKYTDTQIYLYCFYKEIRNIILASFESTKTNDFSSSYEFGRSRKIPARKFWTNLNQWKGCLEYTSIWISLPWNLKNHLVEVGNNLFSCDGCITQLPFHTQSICKSANIYIYNTSNARVLIHHKETLEHKKGNN